MSKWKAAPAREAETTEHNARMSKRTATTPAGAAPPPSKRFALITAKAEILAQAAQKSPEAFKIIDCEFEKLMLELAPGASASQGKKKKKKKKDTPDFGEEAGHLVRCANDCDLRPTALALRMLIRSATQLEPAEAFEALVSIAEAVTADKRGYHCETFTRLFVYIPLEDHQIFHMGLELRDAFLSAAEQCDNEVVAERLGFDLEEVDAMDYDDFREAVEESLFSEFSIEDYGFGDGSEDENYSNW